MVEDEEGRPKAYGAGLLSGCKELQYCVTDTPKHHELVIETAIATSYPETGLQPHYFVAKTLEDMRAKLMCVSYYNKHVGVSDSYIESIPIHLAGTDYLSINQRIQIS